MPPASVLMTADTVGGVWTYAMELARGLAVEGVRTALAAMGGACSPEQRAEAAAVPGLELFESAYRLEWMNDPWRDVAAAGDWLLEIERRARPDVVHLNGYAHGALSWRAPVLMAGHSCVLSWWEAVRQEPAPAEWSRYRAEVARGIRAAGLVVAPTRDMLGALERHYGPLPPSRVIPNGRDPARFRCAEKHDFLFAAGRFWDEAKNLCALDAAAREISWPVLVAGDTRGPAGGQARASHVRLLGPLPAAEVAGYMARAAIYALPARYEPFGLSALEAALSGCALVLGDIPSLREVWGDAAYYVSPTGNGEFAAVLRELIAQPERRAGLALRARRRAFEYGPVRMARAYVSAYQSLANK